MVNTYIAPLDLETIFIQIFAGTTTIFVIMAFIVISICAGRFRMSAETTCIMFVIFGLVIATILPSLYAAILILALLIMFYAFGRFIKA